MIDFDKDVFEAEGSDFKEEILSGDENEELFDREDEALHHLSPEELEMDYLQPSSGEQSEVKKPVDNAAPETAMIKEDSVRDDAEARFGRYLAEKMRMLPKEMQFDDEFTVLGALQEFVPR